MRGPRRVDAECLQLFAQCGGVVRRQAERIRRVRVVPPSEMERGPRRKRPRENLQLNRDSQRLEVVRRQFDVSATGSRRPAAGREREPDLPGHAGRQHERRSGPVERQQRVGNGNQFAGVGPHDFEKLKIGVVRINRQAGRSYRHDRRPIERARNRDRARARFAAHGGDRDGVARTLRRRLVEGTDEVPGIGRPGRQRRQPGCAGNRAVNGEDPGVQVVQRQDRREAGRIGRRNGCDLGLDGVEILRQPISDRRRH